MKRFISHILIILFVLSSFIFTVYAAEPISMTSQAQVQNEGWLEPVGNDGIVGTIGEGLNLEAFEIKLSEGLNGIKYTSHVADIGWQDYVGNGDISGTVGEGKAIQAVKIELTNEAAENYDVYYRIHAPYVAWLGWSKNGEISGTVGVSLPAQAIQVKVVPKNEPFLEDSTLNYIESTEENNLEKIDYSTHVEQIGWTDTVSDGQESGTVGEAKAIEAIKINADNLTNISEDSNIVFSTHVENIGWTDQVSNGEISGTTGEELAVQAFRVNLTGIASSLFDVQYRGQIQNAGWLDWAKNGEISGSEGLGLQLETIEIELVPKEYNNHENTELNYLNRDILAELGNIDVKISEEGTGWRDTVKTETQIGTTGQGQGIEAIAIAPPSIGDSQIIYNLDIEGEGWQGEKANGDVVGTENENKQAEGITIRLAGVAGDLFDIYYQAHSEENGWLGWAKNGERAGTTGDNKKLEAINIVLVPKGDPAPGDTENAYIEFKKSKGITAEMVPQFDLICAVVQHEGGASYTSALAVMSCVMNRCDSGRWGGSDPVSVLTAPGQFSSYLGGYYKQFLGRTSPEVQQAVLDCLNGERSHPYQSFRSYRTSGSVNIGGNWYF